MSERAIGGLNDLQIHSSANIYDPIYPSQHLPLFFFLVQTFYLFIFNFILLYQYSIVKHLPLLFLVDPFRMPL